MMDHPFLVDKLASLAILTLLLLLLRRHAYRTTQLPASPNGFPLIGSILDVSKSTIEVSRMVLLAQWVTTH